MSRIPLIDRNATDPQRQQLLEPIHKAFGTTPNMFRAVANSPAALRSMWGSFGALGAGKLGAALGEQIAVAVANRNRCEYCLAAHTVLGANAGVNADAMGQAQQGKSPDARTQAALTFALRLVEAHGQVSEADLQAVRKAGFDDEAVVEILAHVALNLFTNYVNIAFVVPVDFPHVALTPAAHAA